MRQELSDATALGNDGTPTRKSGEQALVSDRRAVSGDLLAAERLEAAERLGAWFAHEINNPLGAISGSAQLLARRLQRDIKDPNLLRTYLGYVEAIQSQTERCARITGEILSFTQPGDPDLSRFDPVDAVADAVELVRYASPDCPIVVDAGDAGRLVVRADREWLMRVVFELLTNAVQTSGDTVRVSLTSTGDRVSIAVEDDGPGIPDAVADRLFDPFFSTREKARGLGLTVSLDMMRRMDGTLEAASRAGGGAVFTVELRRCEGRD